MSLVNLNMRETTAAKIVGLVRSHMPGGDDRPLEGKRLADMPCDSEASPVGEFIETDHQRRIAKPEHVGTGDEETGSVETESVASAMINPSVWGPVRI